MAQKEAAIPIKAYILSPANTSLKFNRVALKISNADASKIKTRVKIFIGWVLIFQFLYQKRSRKFIKLIITQTNL
jgi:hypothetical protein